MTARRRELLQRAIDCLNLENIVLYESKLTRVQPFPENAEEIWQQDKKHAFLVGEGTTDSSFVNGDQHKMVAFASFGARLVRKADAEERAEEPEVFIEVEADFVLDYLVKDGDVGRDALEEFVNVNVLHNAWPFWRQHLFDVKQRAMLPHFSLGFFPPTEA